MREEEGRRIDWGEEASSAAREGASDLREREGVAMVRCRPNGWYYS